MVNSLAKSEILKNRLASQLAAMRGLVTSHMTAKGNVETDCQRLLILNRLFDVEKAVNGIEEDDCKLAPEYGQLDKDAWGAASIETLEK